MFSLQKLRDLAKRLWQDEKQITQPLINGEVLVPSDKLVVEGEKEILSPSQLNELSLKPPGRHGQHIVFSDSESEITPRKRTRGQFSSTNQPGRRNSLTKQLGRQKMPAGKTSKTIAVSRQNEQSIDQEVEEITKAFGPTGAVLFKDGSNVQITGTMMPFAVGYWEKREKKQTKRRRGHDSDSDSDADDNIRRDCSFTAIRMMTHRGVTADHLNFEWGNEQGTVAVLTICWLTWLRQTMANMQFAKSDEDKKRKVDAGKILCPDLYTFDEDHPIFDVFDWFVNARCIKRADDPSKFDKPKRIEDKIYIRFDSPQKTEDKPFLNIILLEVTDEDLRKGETLPHGGKALFIKIIIKSKLHSPKVASKDYTFGTTNSKLGKQCSLQCIIPFFENSFPIVSRYVVHIFVSGTLDLCGIHLIEDLDAPTSPFLPRAPTNPPTSPSVVINNNKEDAMQLAILMSQATEAQTQAQAAVAAADTILILTQLLDVQEVNPVKEAN